MLWTAFSFALLSTEIKICGSPQEDCSEFATCADTGPGIYTCTCNEGYTGNGKTCEGKKILFRLAKRTQNIILAFLLSERWTFFRKLLHDLLHFSCQDYFGWKKLALSPMILFCFLINFSCLSKKSKYVELHKKIAVNLRHVLTQDLESIHVPVTKDILEMGKLVKVRFGIFLKQSVGSTWSQNQNSFFTNTEFN
jgi:hypothetical protein